MRSWLGQQAEVAESNEGLVRAFVEECRRRQIILPGVTTIERLCADALVAAECRVETRIAMRLDNQMRNCLNDLLSAAVDGRLSRFIWLRQFEIGKNTADMNRLLDRVEFLKVIGLEPEVLDDIPLHRIKRLRRQGERYFTDGLLDIGSNRRLAILATCVVEWGAAMADTVVETNDRITGKVWREAKKLSALRFEQAQVDVRRTARGESWRLTFSSCETFTRCTSPVSLAHPPAGIDPRRHKARQARQRAAQRRRLERERSKDRDGPER